MSDVVSAAETAVASVVASAVASPAPVADDLTVSETTTTVSVGVPMVDVESVLVKFEHDIIGKATFLYDELKALVAKAKAAL